MADGHPAVADLLFELGTEELPPKALERLSQALAAEFKAGLDAAGIGYGAAKSYATPRRLALLISDVATAQADRDIERRGPSVQAAFDEHGHPTPAAVGFARSCGVEVDRLDRVETGKGTWLVYRVHQPGLATAGLLPDIAANALSKLPIPKRMRWGDTDAQFVRPVHWLVFMLGDAVVPCTLLETVAGNQTRGHRFHHPEPISVARPSEYADLLRSEGKVIADFEERLGLIREQVSSTSAALGGRPDLDDELLREVTALNEWPQPISGTFDPGFLAVPQEALVATMKGNQKYFPVFDASGALMNRFITIANLESQDPQVIREGNERVIRPRLADAMFFWEQDGRYRLVDHLDALRDVVFQKDLGSMFDKSERVAALAVTIAEAIGGDPRLARRAGELSRCDLVTQMVFEFPEMQGIMGRYQARRDGEPDEVAAAMDEFYMPRYSGDDLPRTPTGIAVSLAEKLDTLVGIFGIGMRPTGDKDPFALRRSALGALRILLEHRLSIDLKGLLALAEGQLHDRITETHVAAAVYDFMIDRLRGLYGEDGTAHGVFDAVAAVSPRSIVDFDRRVAAVAAFRKRPEGEALAAANKRIGNILRKAETSGPAEIDETRFEHASERELFEQIQRARHETAPAAAEGDYVAILTTLSALRETVDRFFDDVMVMADDQQVRRNRLALLQSLAGQFLQVADISELQA